MRAGTYRFSVIAILVLTACNGSTTQEITSKLTPFSGHSTVLPPRNPAPERPVTLNNDELLASTGLPTEQILISKPFAKDIPDRYLCPINPWHSRCDWDTWLNGKTYRH